MKQGYPRHPFAAMLLGVVLALGVAATAQAEDGKDLVLRDDAKCTTCHDKDEKNVMSIGKTRHGVNADSRTPTCTSCHGDSDKHTNHKGGNRPLPDRTFVKGSTTPVAERNDACLTCHDGNKRTHWSGSKHESSGLACASCHKVHVQDDPLMNKVAQKDVCYSCHKEQRAQTHRISTHPLAAGKMGCSDCHNPHGSEGPKLMVKGSVNETCYTCHAEKRGPFLWEHPPAVDDCMNCHTPHGSTNTGLLRMRSPWLCQRCHADGAPHPGNIYSANQLPGGTNNIMNNPPTGVVNPLTGLKTTQTNPAPQMSNKGCSNCHSQIHGSNHPAGMWYSR